MRAGSRAPAAVPNWQGNDARRALPAMKARVRRGRQQIQQMLESCCNIALDACAHVLSYERRSDGPVPMDCCTDEKGWWQKIAHGHRSRYERVPQ